MDEGNENLIDGDIRRRAQASSNNVNEGDIHSQSSSGANVGVKDEGLSTNSEYCKQLENWLWKCYWQRTLAISAYFTALNQHYGTSTSSPADATSSSSRSQSQQLRQQPGRGFRINFNVFANQG